MALQITIHVEAQDEIGYTRGYIAPTDATDLELDAVDHVDFPATEDEAEWHQGLRDALAIAGWALAGTSHQDGQVFTATVVRA